MQVCCRVRRVVVERLTVYEVAPELAFQVSTTCWLPAVATTPVGAAGGVLPPPPPPPLPLEPQAAKTEIRNSAEAAQQHRLAPSDFTGLRI